MDLNKDQFAEDHSDEQLLAKFLQGDESAFAQLVERYRMELFHFLARFTGSRATADDIFQETFLQVYLSASTFDLSRRLKPWLFTIAANKARDRLRKEKRRSAMSLSAPVDQDGGTTRSYVDLMESDWQAPEEDLQRQEMRDQVRQVVETLPDHQREVLLLAYFHHFAYKDIAEMLNIPLGTVKSRLHAAVGTFANQWKTEHDHQDPRD